MQIVINNVDITPFVQSVELSGDSGKFNRVLTLNLLATNDGRTPAYNVDEGASVSFTYEGSRLFTGVLFAQDLSSDGALSLTAYDTNVYLAKSTDSRIFINKKASEIIRILAQDFGIPLGSIADTGYVIPYLKLANMTLFDMVLKALTITRKQTGKRFFVGNKDGKLTLVSGLSTTRYIFRDGDNLLSASYSRSIEDTKTQVKVVGGKADKQTTVVVKDDAARAKYGVLQAFEEMDEDATDAQIKERAKALLNEQSKVSDQLSVEVLGVKEVDIGTPVYVVNAMTRTNGAYYVTSITHRFETGLHTMALELTRTYDLPAIEINEDEVTKK